MDPLTHIVVGRAVVAAADGRARPARGIAWAAILGALSPDVDGAVAFSGWDRYVRVHEIGTHAIAGALVMAVFTAAVVRAAVQLRFRGRPPAGQRLASSAALFTAATAGAMSHLILDLACGGRIRLGWPLVVDRVTMPLVAMADPWFIAICAAGLLAIWPGQRPLATVSRTILAALIVLLAAKGALLARAIGASALHPPLTALQARWGSLTDWYAFERTLGAVRAWTITSRGQPAVIAMSQPVGPDTPLVQKSRSLETTANFLSVHEFNFPRARGAGGGRIEVLWSDLRYCSVAGGSLGCGVWAGGSFDGDGRLVTQLVKIGSMVQTRPPPK